MRKLLLILMMVSFAGVNTAKAWWVTGQGAISCGKVISNTKKYPEEMKEFYLSWMQGYISGLNYGLDSNKGKINDHDAIWYAVMNRCHEKPLTDLYEAIFWVYHNELTE